MHADHADLLTAFGNALRDLRVAAQMTQAQLSDIAVVGSRSVSRWELGCALPCPDALARLYAWRPALAKLPLPQRSTSGAFIMAPLGLPQAEVESRAAESFRAAAAENIESAIPPISDTMGTLKPGDLIGKLTPDDLARAIDSASSVTQGSKAALPAKLCPSCGRAQDLDVSQVCTDLFHLKLDTQCTNVAIGREALKVSYPERRCTRCVHRKLDVETEPCLTCFSSSPPYPNFQEAPAQDKSIAPASVLNHEKQASKLQNELQLKVLQDIRMHCCSSCVYDAAPATAEPCKTCLSDSAEKHPDFQAKAIEWLVPLAVRERHCSYCVHYKNPTTAEPCATCSTQPPHPHFLTKWSPPPARSKLLVHTPSAPVVEQERRQAEKPSLPRGVLGRHCSHCIHCRLPLTVEPCLTCSDALDKHPKFQAAPEFQAHAAPVNGEAALRAIRNRRCPACVHYTLKANESPCGQCLKLDNAAFHPHFQIAPVQDALRDAPTSTFNYDDEVLQASASSAKKHEHEHEHETLMTYDDALQASAARVKELESELERTKYSLGTLERQAQDICDRMKLAKPALLDADWISNIAILIRHWNETPHVGASKPVSFHTPAILKSVVRLVNSLHNDAFTTAWQKSAVLSQLASFLRALQTDGGSLQDALDVVEASQVSTDLRAVTLCREQATTEEAK